MLVRFNSTQSEKSALGNSQMVAFWLQPGKPFGAKRSSSRVIDKRRVLTFVVPSTEFKWIDPVSSRSHSCCAAVSVTAALLVWFFCGDHSVIQRPPQLWLALIWWSMRYTVSQTRVSVTVV